MLINWRRRFIFSALAFFIITPQAFAWHWMDLWLRPDQQAFKKLEQGQTKLAAKQFKNPTWRAVANYRSGNYQTSNELLKKQNSALANYNRGNSLAHLGQYKKAIAAYDEAIKQDPKNKDAIYNRDLLKKLLQQQKKKHTSKQEQKKQSQNQKKQQQKKQNQQRKSGGKDKKSAEKSPSQGNKSKQNNQQNKNQKNNKQQSAATNKQQENQDKKAKPTPQQQQREKQQQNAKPNDPNNQKKLGGKPLTRRQQESLQSAKQWLRRIPDNPGGLLRQKFYRDHMRQLRKKDL